MRAALVPYAITADCRDTHLCVVKADALRLTALTHTICDADGDVIASAMTCHAYQHAILPHVVHAPPLQMAVEYLRVEEYDHLLKILKDPDSVKQPVVSVVHAYRVPEHVKWWVQHACTT
jgi:hypothetical protein